MAPPRLPPASPPPAPPPPAPAQDRSWQAWVAVACACVANMAMLSVLFSFGVFVVPLAEEFDVGRGDVSWVASIAFLCANLCGLPSGLAAQRFGARPCVLAAGALLATGALASSYATSLGTLYFTCGVMMGVSVSLTSISTSACVVTWFSRYRGVAVGLAMSGAGLGNLVAPLVAQGIMDGERGDWRTSLRVVGVGSGVLLIVAGAFLETRPADDARPKSVGGDEEEPSVVQAVPPPQAHVGPPRGDGASPPPPPLPPRKQASRKRLFGSAGYGGMSSSSAASGSYSPVASEPSSRTRRHSFSGEQSLSGGEQELQGVGMAPSKSKPGQENAQDRTASAYDKRVLKCDDTDPATTHKHIAEAFVTSTSRKCSSSGSGSSSGSSSGSGSSGSEPSRPASILSPVRTALATPYYRHFLGVSACVAFSMNVPVVHLSPSAVDLGFSASQAATLVSTLGAAQIFGRIFHGLMADRFGPVNGMFCGVLAMGVSTILWPTVSDSYAWLAAYAVVYGFNLGTAFVLPPAILGEYFEGANPAGTLGFYFSTGGPSSVLGPAVAGYIFDFTGSYAGAGLSTGVPLLIALFFLWRMRALRRAMLLERLCRHAEVTNEGAFVEAVKADAVSIEKRQAVAMELSRVVSATDSVEGLDDGYSMET